MKPKNAKRFEKLPAWAQEEFVALERRAIDAERRWERVQTDHKNTDTFVGVADDKIGLSPKGSGAVLACPSCAGTGQT